MKSNPNQKSVQAKFQMSRDEYKEVKNQGMKLSNIEKLAGMHSSFNGL